MDSSVLEPVIFGLLANNKLLLCASSHRGIISKSIQYRSLVLPFTYPWNLWLMFLPVFSHLLVTTASLSEECRSCNTSALQNRLCVFLIPFWGDYKSHNRWFAVYFTYCQYVAYWRIGWLMNCKKFGKKWSQPRQDMPVFGYKNWENQSKFFVGLGDTKLIFKERTSQIELNNVFHPNLTHEVWIYVLLEISSTFNNSKEI
jgi:hypothetical protein